MKKYLMTVMAAVALGGLFTGCSNDADLSGGNTAEFNIVQNYENAFVTRFGQPHENQTWGFGDPAASTRALTRSQNAPACPDITQPYDEAWVSTYCQTAKEPNSTNVNDNYDNSVYHEAEPSVWVKTKDRYYVEGKESEWVNGSDWQFDWQGVGSTLFYNATNIDYSWFAPQHPEITEEDYTIFRNYVLPYCQENWQAYGKSNRNGAAGIMIGYLRSNNRGNWINVRVEGSEGHYTEATEGYWVEEEGYWTEAKAAYWDYDENYVTNFKITGTWNGSIGVAASEGSSSPGAERTIVVTGTWNITENQRIGSFGKIIIANGGTVNVSSGCMLNMVNQARLVVLPGGQLTGAGSVEVNNGNAEGEENYNGGTIDVATFNNNFGKFYNYNKFLVTEYQGGAKESNFYNHALVNIHHFAGTGSTANARIFNACQFYVQTNARIRNYEGIGGSALIVGGQLMFSSSEDGTSTPTYVGLADGALVKCNTLYNNGTSWTGPTSGYAALEIGRQIVYLNWQQDHPEDGGYFENNIYVKCGTWDNVPDGNGYHQTDESDTYNHSLSIADYKFWNTVANCRGNGGVKKVEDGNKELLPASEDFVLGSAGCTPGFKGKGDTPVVSDEIICRIIAEDLTVGENSDFDFNDVVFDVIEGGTKLRLRAAGGELPLYVAGQEVHEAFATKYSGITRTTLINTGWNGPVDYENYYVDISSGGTYSTRALAETIPIVVHKNGRQITLKAEKAKVASKIAVGSDFEWCSEREDIDKKFRKKDYTKLFQQYVRGISPYNNDDWTSGKTWYQYRGE